MKVKPKAKCCEDTPRCKRCPVVLKRLEKAGIAQRTKRGAYRVPDGLSKGDLKPYRARVA
jgi:predicted transcriptional regulator of viral defense system